MKHDVLVKVLQDRFGFNLAGKTVMAREYRGDFLIPNSELFKLEMNLDDEEGPQYEWHYNGEDCEVVGKMPIKVRIVDSDYSCKEDLIGKVFNAKLHPSNDGYLIAYGELMAKGCLMQNTSKGPMDEWYFSAGSCEIVDEQMEDHTEEYTGGSSSYYMLYIKHPTTLEDPYHAECNDIIETLNMTPAEANVFKGVWRKAAARTLGVKKKGYDSGVYDSEKCVFFSERMLVRARIDNEGG